MFLKCKFRTKISLKTAPEFLLFLAQKELEKSIHFESKFDVFFILEK